MFQTAVLASGSKGNCTLIRTENTSILVDAGLSGKRIFNAMEQLHLHKEKVCGLIISHEHGDHIKGAGVVCRKLKIPLYIMRTTHLSMEDRLGKLPEGVVYYQSGKSFSIGDIDVDPFVASHDVDCCNFTFQQQNSDKKLGLATDLGFSSRLMLQKMKGVNTLILESNHDEKLLLEGPYPWELKQRVKSRHGHLSNNQAVEVVRKIIHDDLQTIILAHLSEINNMPELAHDTMKQYLQDAKHNCRIVVSSQDEPTRIIDI
ncbi:MAG: MBL fold metallo-hydrolase [Candidatus Cloacimonetes bacterium]|nr:MBL fold metallo-hydrolase [Candidatus Cloacimonadota bacterium]